MSIKELLLTSNIDYYVDLVRTVFDNASQLRQVGHEYRCSPCPFNNGRHGCNMHRLFYDNGLEHLGLTILQDSCGQLANYQCNYFPEDHLAAMLEERTRLEDLELRRLRREEKRKQQKHEDEKPIDF